MSNKSTTNEDDKSGETSKHITPEGENWHISNMPRDIVHQILLFLPFEYSIILGMVSSQWQGLLHETSILNIDENEIVSKMMRQISGVLHEEQPQINGLYECKQRFAEFVNRVIFYRSDCRINYARLSLEYEPTPIYFSDVNNWVHFLMTRDHMETLDLSFSSTPKEYFELQDLAVRRTRSFEVPHQPYEPKFKCFILKSCKLTASKFGSLMNLKVLYLTDVDILDISIGQLVSKCPVLEELYLVGCTATDNFFVCKQDLNIKHLIMQYCWTKRRGMFMIDISVPQLTNLKITERYLMSSTIRNATNLEDFSIDINPPFSYNEQGNFLAMIMTNVRNCKTLALSRGCIKVLPMSDIDLKRQLHGSFTNLTSLRLTVGYVKPELPGIVLLLQNCPCLESLMLEINHKDKTIPFLRFVNYMFQEANNLENQDPDIVCLQNSLKVLKIHGLKGRDEEIHLLEFLLRKALVLENLVILHDFPDESETQESAPSDRELHQLRMLQALQGLPRASSVVQVSVEKVEFSNDQ